MERNRRGWWAAGGLLAAFVLFLASGPASGQDPHIRLAPDTVESLLTRDSFDLVLAKDTRFEGDRTQQALLDFSGRLILVKWAPAPAEGSAFNNEPRYELAAYRVQKLFLDPADYVVPPTVVRCFPLDWYHEELKRLVSPTFPDTKFVMVALQYWVFGVGAENVFDETRFERDPAYARHLANLNILTYLIRHNDANRGNVLLSKIPDNPRLFAVDNGLAFGSEGSYQGHDWRRLRVDRLPRESVERLRGLTREKLQRELGVLAQFEEREGHPTAVEPGKNLDPGKGVRRGDRVVQLGLTEKEVSGVWDRLAALLERVDSGELGLF